MITSFCERNASTLAWSCSCEADQLVLLGLELLHLHVEALQLLLDRRLALERGAREILAIRRDGLVRLPVELDDALLELGLLELEALLRGDDVGEAALDVLQQLELLLVRVVESLAGILRPVEQLRDLRLGDRRGARDQAGHPSSFSGSGVAYRSC